MNNELVGFTYTDANIEPNTITFNSAESTWVMKITADRKIIVNDDVEVSEAAQAVLDALQPLLFKTHPSEHDLGVAEAIGFDKGYKAATAKTLTDKEIADMVCSGEYWELSEGQVIIAVHFDKFARAILRKASEK